MNVHAEKGSQKHSNFKTPSSGNNLLEGGAQNGPNRCAMFELCLLITNLKCKLSTATEYDARKQLLCFVSEDNDIVLRYTSSDIGPEVLKLISWFRRTNRVIHDVCFDPSGTWLLVLCFDNTLHIVPALAVVDRTYAEQSNAACPQQPYSTAEITSYIIPFVGPHECPNSKECPNHGTNHPPATATTSTNDNNPPTKPRNSCLGPSRDSEMQHLLESLQQVSLGDAPANASAVDDDEDIVVLPTPGPAAARPVDVALIESFSHDLPASMLAPSVPPSRQYVDSTGNSQVMASSFMASKTCPYPLSVVWWQTIEGVNRAVIGYSDGSICFVGLSPNCPFVASTAIDTGSVVKLLICKDNTFESVMMLITSSLKQQFKLLLEQKAIQYIYPGDISPSTAKGRESDWQIVMPVKTNSNCSDPASDSSQLDEDVFVKSAEDVTATSAAVTVDQRPQTAVVRPTMAQTYVGPNNEIPPPPPYSVAINRHAMASDAVAPSALPSAAALSAPAAKSTAAVAGSVLPAGTRHQQQQQQELQDFDDMQGRAGILPAARARLASLKSLGTKKLNAIKMRLSDNRQKLEECKSSVFKSSRQRLERCYEEARKKLLAERAIERYIKKFKETVARIPSMRSLVRAIDLPENTLASSFAIMDSPSLTPEMLANNATGSFYTIQNLRSTYLLSALHCQSNSLSVHNIDINLKPLFLYKIPKNCFDILISSNILYSIQYVDVNGSAQSSPERTHRHATESNTEKENRDRDVEKDETYADVRQTPAAPVDTVNAPDLCNDVEMGNVEAGDASKTNSSESSAPTSGDSTRSGCETPSHLVNAVGVLSSAMASLRSGEEDRFNDAAQLGLFRFEHETVLNLYQMATYRSSDSGEAISKEDKTKAFASKAIRSPMDYVRFYTSASVREEYSLRQLEIMQNEFPKINYDPCYVVTNKNVYYIRLKKEPFAIFLDAALAGDWTQCREFCNTFDLTYEACIEFAGDFLLRRNKITQALFTYNAARIKPIRIALKLAMSTSMADGNEIMNALMHLCAMALRSGFLLKSRYFCHPIIRTMISDITYRHSEDVRRILPVPPPARDDQQLPLVVNEGAACSDYAYGVHEPLSSLQMSPSSQFHLANLLLITLAEKAVNDKNYLPLWNFLVTNTKYHTNMTSIVLCQSGLFSAALLLAKTRGVCIDTFLAMTSVVGQEFGWYTELNVCLYNLSESLFAETITYLPHVSLDYFSFIQDKLDQIRPCVLKRLAMQLNPFGATHRPIVSHTSSGNVQQHAQNDNNFYLFDFCKSLIETYLAVLVHMESQRSKRGRIANALSTFRITYEDNQFAIESSRFKPISAGCAHCACVVDGVAYFWGSNGVPCNYSVNKSSDPPEPPYAVKSLELLSQLNLEVHAVKCGRQHTLILTNNGLYAFGNNNLVQLGIGTHMQVALQPMLVDTLDGKNITLLEVGQYHNAVVADGQLYTWGWGVFGQLGHGDTENWAKPKLVSFFKYKKVIQVSLGHAHSLVLCQAQTQSVGPAGAAGSSSATELYVFGSNHFGQLGTGISTGDDFVGSIDEEVHCTNQVKSLLPLRLDVSSSRIRLIHTKFFINLAVDENERMYTWGSSPQALRLANQIKRRANAKQKIEEHQRREMSKRFEATLSTATTAPAQPNSIPLPPKVQSIAVESQHRAMPPLAPRPQELNARDDPDVVPLSCSIASNDAHDDTDKASKMAAADEIITPIAAEFVAATRPPSLSDPIIDTAVEEFVAEVKPLESTPLQAIVHPTIQVTACEEKKVEKQPPAPPPPEVSPCEHMSPHLVDTSEVAGEILQISSGLFHCALISSSCTLYTWGKNLEHQLGTGDKERRPVNKPSPIDSIERPMYIDCGADFTLVMTTEYMVKAFGGNSNGQCGRDLGPTIDKVKQRVVCLPSTKRLMRFESQCVEIPVEINLPRPRIRLDNEPVRYLKSIPRYRPHFVQDAGINFDDTHFFERPSASLSPSHQYKSTTQADSNENNPATGQDSDDMISSLENYSNNDCSSLNLSNNPSPAAAGAATAFCAAATSDNNAACLCQSENCSCDATPDEQSYVRLPATDNMDHSIGPAAGNPVVEPLIGAALAADTASTLTSDEGVGEEANLQELRHFIHYCLYVFHGLYNPDRVREFARDRLEYRIRTHMLNFKFIEAFRLCLQDCCSAHKALKVFEYFTKDTGNVPMRRQDLKYLIYYLLQHCLSHKFEMHECERFFLADLDYYLLELSYVLYFNNNNTALEQTLNEKFKSMIAQDDCNQNEQEHKLEDTDAIFDSFSVKFKTIVCQKLIKHCSH